jgi:hypothetical protein
MNDDCEEEYSHPTEGLGGDTNESEPAVAALYARRQQISALKVNKHCKATSVTYVLFRG